MLVVVPAIAAAPPPPTPVVCGVTSNDKATHSFVCKESGGRITTYKVNAASRFTLNGAPMTSGMHIGDKCSIMVSLPPTVDTGTCTR